MSWKRENTRDGLSIWRGRDSIVNLHQLEASQHAGCLYPLLAVVVVIAVLFIAEGGGDRPIDLISSIAGWVMLLASVPVVWFVWKLAHGGGLSLQSFFDEEWTLREMQNATFKGLTFRRMESGNRPAESWSAPLADIARVEAGSTQQWISSRRLGNVIHPVSEAESQVFLFMNDGSRRVICSINGNREVAATLAQSVRSWLEAMKARPAAPLRSYARAEGFDI
ncbi:MAG: hypothetical protein QOD42_1898 [Sphingomonadales bacterium]|jgi:hypothetical protein|nr:hypothetical protein [Sphingomonadales bacterium]